MVGSADPLTEALDLGVLGARLLFAIQDELYARLARDAFDGLHPRRGTVLAYIGDDGMRATEVARLSGQHKQVVGVVIDDLESLGYVRRHPEDGRAKLVCHTDRGRRQKRAGDAIMRDIQRRHSSRLGEAYRRFLVTFPDVVSPQRDSATP